MDIRIGDIVRFISEKLEGKVTSLIDTTTVNVYCDEYGFEIPASITDLVVIRSDFNAPAQQSGTGKTPLQQQKAVSVQSADTVYLAIVPENFNNLADSRYELFMVNDTAQTCLYTVTAFNGEKYSGIIAGNCNPDAVSPIGTYTLKEIDNQLKALNIQVIFFQKGITTPKAAIDTQIKLNPVNLCKSGSYKHSKWFEGISLLRPLDKETIQKMEIDEKQLKQAIQEKKITAAEEAPRPHKQFVGNILEIDLHIGQLLDTTAGMENKDILEYQMNVFHKTLEEYRLRKGQKIVFIHGKGDGILRQRILWELQTKYKRFNHQDASFKQYGYGATMVTIK